jgi:hypothetical protein
VQVLDPDGVTPIAGASVFFTATPAVSFSVCSGGASCTVLTDESGLASTQVTPLSAGTMTISAVLAPASYKTPSSVQTTLVGTSLSLDITLSPAYAWIAQGATVDLPLTSRALSNGVPLSGRALNYFVSKGSATLSFSTTQTDINGYSTTTLHISAMAGDVQVSACIGVNNNPCQSFYGTAVPTAALRLQAVSGNNQIVSVGQIFQPVVTRVTDSDAPPHPVLAASVTFQSIISRTAPAPPPVSLGGIIITRNPMPAIVSSSQTVVPSDASGLATVQPATGANFGAVEILETATAGVSTLQFSLQSLWPVITQGMMQKQFSSPSDFVHAIPRPDLQ